jgi:hypothetical protein
VEWWSLLDEVPELVGHETETYWRDMRLTLTGVTLVVQLHLLAFGLRSRPLRLLLVLVAMLAVDEAEIAVVADSVLAPSHFGIVENLETYMIWDGTVFA